MVKALPLIAALIALLKDAIMQLGDPTVPNDKIEELPNALEETAGNLCREAKALRTLLKKNGL